MVQLGCAISSFTRSGSIFGAPDNLAPASEKCLNPSFQVTRMFASRAIHLSIARLYHWSFRLTTLQQITMPSHKDLV